MESTAHELLFSDKCCPQSKSFTKWDFLLVEIPFFNTAEYKLMLYNNINKYHKKITMADNVDVEETVQKYIKTGKCFRPVLVF